MKRLVYHEAAEAELLEAISYLELQVTGLGRRFFADVQRSEVLIRQFPLASPEILPGIRKRVLQKFSYSLIYAVETDAVTILAVAHHRRRPWYWTGR